MNKHPTWERRPGHDPGLRYRLTSVDMLRAAMVANGFMSGNQLAKATNGAVKVGTINHLVHGRRNTASSKTVGAIREALGRDARDLFVPEKSTVPVDPKRAA